MRWHPFDRTLKSCTMLSVPFLTHPTAVCCGPSLATAVCLGMANHCVPVPRTVWIDLEHMLWRQGFSFAPGWKDIQVKEGVSFLDSWEMFLEVTEDQDPVLSIKASPPTKVLCHHGPKPTSLQTKHEPYTGPGRAAIPYQTEVSTQSHCRYTLDHLVNL